MQQPGESYDEWKYRLIIGKAKKELSISWNEICVVLDLPYRSEYIRKIAYGILEYCNYLEAKYEDGLSKAEIAKRLKIRDELQDEREKLQREKMRLADQKREYNNAQRRLARSEHIESEIIRAAEILAKARPIPIKPIPESAGLEREGALLFSDWHAGVKNHNYWNTFNDVELQKRVTRIVERAIKYGHEQKVGKMHVFLLGDIINGLIHVTTRINNTENVIAQTQLVAELLSQVLARLASEFPEVIVYAARGNHDRVSANIKESVAEESFFDFIPWFLKARLKDIKNITFIDNEVDSEIITAEISGQTIFAVHGHRDKLNKAVSDLSQMIRKFPDFLFMGHYHHMEEKEDHCCEVIVNSTLSGVDDFAKDTRKTSKSSQKFLVFDKEEGRLCTYNIKTN